ncbi:MAG TPA: dUTP diphosphatase [Phycisphaerales bacterium]|nr:dUTP diphosphatase [Phycisphaerales bacterium]
MSSPVTVRLKRLSPRATLPQYHSDQAAGMDLAACLDSPVTIAPGQIVKIPLGFAVALPIGYEAQIRPRSGLATRHGVTVPNSPGTVDSDYRGEMVVALINLGREPFTVEPGARVAQMIVAPVSHASILEVDELDSTTRGTGGFGSTGLG